MERHNVVISGIAGCFPNCENLEEFTKALFEKSNLITDFKNDWSGSFKVPTNIGRIKSLHDFDHTFLSINLPLAKTMDRHHKTLLRFGYECILDGGYAPTEIKGKNIGVYLHTTLSDDEMKNCTVDSGTLPILVGVARTMYANRISAYFDIHGPSISHQGAFENAMQTLERACDDVSTGRCEGAIVGASNICLNPEPGLQLQALGLLTNDMVNRPLDDNANGYIRADSTVVFFIQREGFSRRNYASIVNIGVQFCGDRLGTFQSRNEKHIIKLLEKTYRKAKISPNDIGYVETGSWANKELDTQELILIQNFFAKNRANNDPLLIGSVVGNTGFTEAASGFVSLVKTIISFRTGIIPPTLHIQKVNVAVGPNVKIVTENTPSKEYACVNSFGISGGFSHCILKKPPMVESLSTLKSDEELTISARVTAMSTQQDELPRLYYIAARDADHADELFKKLSKIAPNPYIASTLCDIFRREIKGYMARCVAVYPIKKKEVKIVKTYERSERPIWFLFSGMGSQWQAMGKDLMKFPIFAKTIDRVDVVLREYNIDIKHIITNEEDTAIFDDILNSFVGIASIQLGLVDMLTAMGIKPDGLIGHSVGELGCAYADGCLSAEQVILAALYRGKASKEAELIEGMMAAVGLGYTQIKPFLPPDIEVACHNSAQSCTLSGPSESVKEFVNHLTEKGVFAKAVNVSNIAYHSRYIKPAAPLLLKYLQKVIQKRVERSAKWISTSITQMNWDTDLAKYCSAEYFTNNLLSSVYFEEGARLIPSNAIVIEIAPHGLLQPILKKSSDPDTIQIALTNRSKSVDSVEYFLEAIGQLYLNGCEPNVNAIFPAVDYPLPADVPNISQFLTWDFSIPSNVGLHYGATKTWSKSVVLGICSKRKYQHLVNYKINNKFVIPPAIYLELVYRCFVKNNPDCKKIVIENFRLNENDVDIFLRTKSEISIGITKVTGMFEVLFERLVKDEDTGSISLKSTVLASGIIKVTDEIIPKVDDWKTEIGVLKFDSYLENLKFSIPERKCVGYLTKYLEGITTTIQSNGFMFDLIDNCLKVVIIDHSDYKKPKVPYFIQKMVLDVTEIKSYRKGESVKIHYDPLTHQILSPAILIERVRTKEFRLDSCEPSKDYKGPLDYFTSMKYVNLEDIDVEYAGISSQISINNSIIDYSGVTKMGNKIIGVVSYIDSMINLDKTLVWSIPSTWNLEKAVTIPLNYAMAYLCLVQEKSCYRSKNLKSTLIIAGDTAFGEACIAVALAQNKIVFSTVSSDEGYTNLRRRFPELPAKNIFYHENDDYYFTIMTDTHGKGVDLVINPIKSERIMNVAWCCMGEINGELIQLGIEEENKLGMYRFLNSQSFLSTNSKVVLDCNDETKQEIHNFIETGIATGCIKPIENNINVSYNINEYDPIEIADDVTYSIFPMNSRHSPSVPILNVNPDSSYVILGGSGTYELCEWLLQRGAKKILIEHSDEFRATQMSTLLEKYGAIIMVSRNNCTTQSGTESLLTDARSLGVVAGVFAVNLKGNSCKVKLENMKKVCQEQKSSVFLASLLCSEAYGWHFEMKAAKTKTIRSELPLLDSFLKSRSKYSMAINYNDKAAALNAPNQMPSHPNSFLNVNLPCPTSYETYDVSSTISSVEVPQFIEETSKSMKRQFSYGTQSLFFLPAYSTTNMRTIIQNVLYPSFLAHIPIGLNMNDIVEHLYKSLKQCQNDGIYTIVTESWSSIIAIKLGEYIEKKGGRVVFIFLDSSPFPLRDTAIEHKQIFNNIKNLSNYILQRDDNLVLESQKKECLNGFCNIILDRVRLLLESEVEYKFSGECFVVTSKHSYSNIRDQYKMFKTISSILTTNLTSPTEFSTSKDVLQFINDNAAHSFW